MDSPYKENAGAKSYLEFLTSNDGQTFKQVISSAVLGRLAGQKRLSVLDAGCGPGWLTKILSDAGHQAKACDISPQLIKKAKADFPEIDFQIADLAKRLPYRDEEFDCVILSLSALDLKDQRTAYAEIRRLLKKAGRLIIITVNPYFGYPADVWKRGLVGKLLMKKPRLMLRPYFGFARKNDRAFDWNGNKLTSYFYTLPEQINLLLELGFSLNQLADLGSDVDDKKYSLKYRLYRFPIFALMDFAKG